MDQNPCKELEVGVAYGSPPPPFFGNRKMIVAAAVDHHAENFMPDVEQPYVAAVRDLSQTLYRSSGDSPAIERWTMTNDRELALGTNEADVIFVNSIELLQVELERRNPSPEAMTRTRVRGYRNDQRVEVTEKAYVCHESITIDVLFDLARQHGEVWFTNSDASNNLHNMMVRKNQWTNVYVDTVKKGKAEFIFDSINYEYRLRYNPVEANKLANAFRRACTRRKTAAANFNKHIPVAVLSRLFDRAAYQLAEATGGTVINWGSIKLSRHHYREPKRRTYCVSALECVRLCKLLKHDYRVDKSWREAAIEAAKYNPPSLDMYPKEVQEFSELIKVEARACKRIQNRIDREKKAKEKSPPKKKKS